MKIKKIIEGVNEFLDSPPTKKENDCIAKLQIFKHNYVKIVLALIFVVGLWWLEKSWIVAFTFLVAVYGHELGHQWAMRSIGVECKGIWVVPFFGGIAVQSGESKINNWERWLIAMMGPFFGLCMALVPFLVYQYILAIRFKNHFPSASVADKEQIASFAIVWIKVARDIAIFNLVNLLPLPLLDGGRIIGEMILSFSRTAAIIFFVFFLCLAVWLVVKIGSVFIAVLSVLGAIVLYLRWRDNDDRKKMYGVEIFIAFILYLGMFCGLVYIVGTSHQNLRSWETAITMFKKG